MASSTSAYHLCAAHKNKDRLKVMAEEVDLAEEEEASSSRRCLKYSRTRFQALLEAEVDSARNDLSDRSFREASDHRGILTRADNSADPTTVHRRTNRTVLIGVLGLRELSGAPRTAESGAAPSSASWAVGNRASEPGPGLHYCSSTSTAMACVHLCAEEL